MRENLLTLSGFKSYEGKRITSIEARFIRDGSNGIANVVSFFNGIPKRCDANFTRFMYLSKNKYIDGTRDYLFFRAKADKRLDSAIISDLGVYSLVEPGELYSTLYYLDTKGRSILKLPEYGREGIVDFVLGFCRPPILLAEGLSAIVMRITYSKRNELAAIDYRIRSIDSEPERQTYGFIEDPS